LWDLRDSAYDHPDVWADFSADNFFQALATTVDELPEVDRAHPLTAQVLARALEGIFRDSLHTETDDA